MTVFFLELKFVMINFFADRGWTLQGFSDTWDGHTDSDREEPVDAREVILRDLASDGAVALLRNSNSVKTFTSMQISAVNEMHRCMRSPFWDIVFRRTLVFSDAFPLLNTPNSETALSLGPPRCQ